jgi:hypothetical protein
MAIVSSVVDRIRGMTVVSGEYKVRAEISDGKG